MSGSGQVLADRRLAYGLMLRESGDLAGAVSVLEQALELAPRWPAGLFTLAETLVRVGRHAEAVKRYHDCLAAEPTDRLGAWPRLVILGAAPVPDRLPAAHVRSLFDQYAPRFDTDLVGRLGYRAPGLLRSAVTAALAVMPACPRMLDLGCGTGLVGETFRDLVSWLEGVDLAPDMVREAARKGLYDRLMVADAIDHLMGQNGPEVGGGRFDLVTAADLVPYLGDLAPLFRGVGAVLQPGGLFAFSAETGADADYTLGVKQRFLHHPAYLGRLAADTGFEIFAIDRTPYRTETGEPVSGVLVVLRQPVPPAPILPVRA